MFILLHYHAVQLSILFSRKPPYANRQPPLPPCSRSVGTDQTLCMCYETLRGSARERWVSENTTYDINDKGGDYEVRKKSSDEQFAEFVTVIVQKR